MRTNRLLLTLEAPLAVSQARDTSNRYALPPAVPPTTLRGALAAVAEKGAATGAEETPSMDDLFGPRGCRTSALLPSDPGMPGEVAPAPLTLRTCKRHGGLREEGGHGIEDVLFDALLFALRDNAEGLRALRLCRAEDCSQVLTDMSGVLGAAPDASFFRPPEPSTRAQAHVGLDRRRQGAASGILYSREVISEKTGTAGGDLSPTPVQADVTGTEEVIEFLSSVLQGATLQVGTARSRGLGTCQVQAFEEVAPSTMMPALPPLEQRINQFNERWGEWCEQRGESPGGPLVSLTLQTPALFVDDVLRPTLAPDGAALLQAAHEEEHPAASALEDLEKAHQIARPTQVQSWNGMAEFPHRSAQGLAPGSVLVFRAEDLDEPLFNALRHVEGAGIGLRRHFGFGRVRVCSPIHTHLHEHLANAHA